jgi:SPP1 gp7 family putative phage head morphogenesis protein
MESALGINIKQLIQKEAMSPTINALMIETAQWAKRLRDETLQNFTANTLRSMALGNTIDGVLKEFDLSKSKQKNSAKFVARNQLSNFNGILTKLRFQKVGIEQGEWVTTEDDKVRKCHKARNGKIFDLSKGCYSSCDGKWLYPGTDYNCRCIMKAIIKEFEE